MIMVYIHFFMNTVEKWVEAQRKFQELISLWDSFYNEEITKKYNDSEYRFEVILRIGSITRYNT